MSMNGGPLGCRRHRASNASDGGRRAPKGTSEVPVAQGRPPGGVLSATGERRRLGTEA